MSHPTKTGRNDDCPCGSGRKYKKCCLNKPAVAPSDLGLPPTAEAWATTLPEDLASQFGTLSQAWVAGRDGTTPLLDPSDLAGITFDDEGITEAYDRLLDRSMEAGEGRSPSLLEEVTAAVATLDHLRQAVGVTLSWVHDPTVPLIRRVAAATFIFGVYHWLRHDSRTLGRCILLQAIVQAQLNDRILLSRRRWSLRRGIDAAADALSHLLEIYPHLEGALDDAPIRFDPDADEYETGYEDEQEYEEPWSWTPDWYPLPADDAAFAAILDSLTETAAGGELGQCLLCSEQACISFALVRAFVERGVHHGNVPRAEIQAIRARTLTELAPLFVPRLLDRAEATLRTWAGLHWAGDDFWEGYLDDIEQMARAAPHTLLNLCHDRLHMRHVVAWPEVRRARETADALAAIRRGEPGRSIADGYLEMMQYEEALRDRLVADIQAVARLTEG